MAENNSKMEDFERDLDNFGIDGNYWIKIFTEKIGISSLDELKKFDNNKVMSFVRNDVERKKVDKLLTTGTSQLQEMDVKKDRQSFARQHSNKLINVHADVMKAKSGNRTSKNNYVGLSRGNASLPTTPESSEGMASSGERQYVGAAHLPASVAELQMGNIKLQLTTGDITQETTDGIVNNTNSNLDLSLGFVSRALLNAGGRSFEAECQKLGSIRPNTAVATGSGSMLCKYVIHVDVASPPIKWIEIIKRCLQTAEGKRMRSLTFPALGTGAYAGDPAEMAMNLIDAVTDFASSHPTHLTLIRVVVLDNDLFRVYLSKMEEA